MAKASAFGPAVACRCPMESILGVRRVLTPTRRCAWCKAVIELEESGRLACDGARAPPPAGVAPYTLSRFR
jgi:hypothetical protein